MSVRLFQAYVAVDWSAASRPATGPDSIWIGVFKRNVRFKMAFEAHNPATRAEADKLIDAQLNELRRKDERVLLGVDFPLGFPRGTAHALKLEGQPWRGNMDFVARETKDRPTNANNRFQVAAKMNRLMTGAAFPFWGCPPRDAQTMLSAKRPREHRDGDLPEFRLAETAAKGASSIWKMYFQGSVGGQALTGMPMIQRLRNARADAAKVWPFETGWKPLSDEDVAGLDVVFAEIYPSLLEVKLKSGEVKDAAQVRALAEHFAALDEKSKLAPLFGPTGDDDRRIAIEQEEGWILGAGF
jgi:hypothetical protein